MDSVKMTSEISNTASPPYPIYETLYLTALSHAIVSPHAKFDMSFSDAARLIIREGVRANCPLQIQPHESRCPSLVEYDSNASPWTTGPSSVLMTPSEGTLEETAVKLSYPEASMAYKDYHSSKFTQPRVRVVEVGEDNDSNEAEDAEDLDKYDSSTFAQQLIKNNKLNGSLFAALCPWNFNETPVFLYGRLTCPRLLAELLANNDKFRVYEQAARMYPAKLQGHRLANIGETDIQTVVPQQDGDNDNDDAGAVVAEAEVEGYVLFSTSIRERVIIKESRGKAFESVDAHATVMVDDREVKIPVMTTVATEQWMQHAVLL